MVAEMEAKESPYAIANEVLEQGSLKSGCTSNERYAREE